MRNAAMHICVCVVDHTKPGSENAAKLIGAATERRLRTAKGVDDLDELASDSLYGTFNGSSGLYKCW